MKNDYNGKIEQQKKPNHSHIHRNTFVTHRPVSGTMASITISHWYKNTAQPSLGAQAVRATFNGMATKRHYRIRYVLSLCRRIVFSVQIFRTLRLFFWFSSVSSYSLFGQPRRHAQTFSRLYHVYGIHGNSPFGVWQSFVHDSETFDSVYTCTPTIRFILLSLVLLNLFFALPLRSAAKESRWKWCRYPHLLHTRHTPNATTPHVTTYHRSQRNKHGLLMFRRSGWFY